MRLWSRLRANRSQGHKFKRQHAVGAYIVDFVGIGSHLVIEVDGDSHGDDRSDARDAARTTWLQSQGFPVIRFWNHDVLEDTDSVMESIYHALERAAVPG